MPAVFRPRECPGCGERFQFGYAERRHARMAVGARLALIAGIATTIVLVPCLLFLAGQWVSDLTEGMGLRQRERGLIVFFACLPPVVVALLPAWLGWRYAFSRPRRLAVTCPNCRWQGICQVKELELALPDTTGDVVYYESEFQGIPNPESPTRKRLERLEERKRKQARRADREAGPNPDLDFENGSPTS